MCARRETRTRTCPTTRARCSARSVRASVTLGAMERLHGLDALPFDAERTVVTVGFFDGVHLGHRAVLGRTVDAARERGLPSVAVTFNRHPPGGLLLARGPPRPPPRRGPARRRPPGARPAIGGRHLRPSSARGAHARPGT